MTEIRVEVPATFAAQLQPALPWVATILEINLARFRTPTYITAAEIIEFLVLGPDPLAVRTSHVSERAQLRLRYLLAMNSAGIVSGDENAEMDEIERLEHILISMKLHALELMRTDSSA